MKRTLALICLFLFFITSYSADITIGKGTVTSCNIPFNLGKNYGTTQTIYTPSELLGGGTITALSYEVIDPYPSEVNLRIYLGHTSQGQFKRAVLEEEVQLVYSSKSQIIGGNIGWETFSLDKPFVYNGIDNLVVIVCKDVFANNISLTYSCFESEKRTIVKNSDGDIETSRIIGGKQYEYSDLSPNTKFTFNHDKGEIIVDGCKYWIDGVSKMSLVDGHDVSGKLIIENKDNHVWRIYPRAFEFNKSIKQVQLSNTITEIGNAAFANCDNLSKVELSESLQNINDSTFINCWQIQKISLPNSIHTIGEHAFSGCTGIYKVNFGNSTTNIKDYAFYDCEGISDIFLPLQIDSIGSYAFTNCAIEELKLPQSLIYIGNNAFQKNTHLSSIMFPHNVKTVRDAAFEGCSNLKKVIIEDGTSQIMFMYKVFDSCPIESVYVGRDFEFGHSNINSQNPFETKSTIVNVEFGGLVKKIPAHAFAATNIKKIILPANIEEIGDYAFNGCDFVDSVFVHNGNMTFGEMSMNTTSKYVYFNCMTNTTPFYRVGSIKEIVIGDDVETICNKSFNLLPRLEKITIGKNVETIRNEAFSECRSLKDIYCMSEEPPHCYSDVFKETPIEKITLHVQDQCIEEYRSAKTWKEFGAIVSASLSTVLVNKIVFEKNEINLCIEESISLNATIEPSNATEKGFTWSSNNEDVAAVDDRGKVVAKSLGTAVITAIAKDGSGKTASCVVTVTGKSVYSITMSQETASMTVGDSLTLTAAVDPSDATVKGIIWSSSNEDVAVVDEKGKITALSEGFVTIIATSVDNKQISVYCNITIIKPSVIDDINRDENIYLWGIDGTPTNILYRGFYIITTRSTSKKVIVR